MCLKPATSVLRWAAATMPSCFCLPVSAFAPVRSLLSSSKTLTGEREKSSFEARGCFTIGCLCLRM